MQEELFKIEDIGCPQKGHVPCIHVQRMVSHSFNPNDVWYTPDYIAKDIIEFFNPSGKILDPCKGEGAFLQYLPNAEWCEIREGRDFFSYNEQVDWIIGNPPNSIYTEWFSHSIKLAHNIVYMIPIHKVFGSWGRLMSLRDWGWIKHIRFHGQSRVYGYNVGFVCAAIHFQKGYTGDISHSFFNG